MTGGIRFTLASQTREQPDGMNTSISDRRSRLPCEDCLRLLANKRDLANYLPGHGNNVKDSWKLGTFGQIKSHSCPLCELIVATYAMSSTTPSDDERVLAIWDFRTMGLQLAAESYSNMRICYSEVDVEPSRLRRAVRRTSAPIDLAVPERFLSSCEKEHYGCSEAPRRGTSGEGVALAVFRVIDVEKMCLVNPPPDCRYAALSYVWGRGDDGRLLLTKEMAQEDKLYATNGLRTRLKSVSKTIQDAITLTRGLGVPFLWVDSLCLAQDDPAELAKCVDEMDLVYERAFFTIIAASGKDAHQGLPGIGDTPREGSVERRIGNGLHMVLVLDFERGLLSSQYITRGWTMQEELCATRSLIFINDQVYFRCTECTWSEDTAVEDHYLYDLSSPGYGTHTYMKKGIEHKLRDGHTLHLGDTKMLPLLSEFLHEFGKRNFGNEGDVFRASAGIIARLSRYTGESVFQGLPLPLHRSVLFYRKRISQDDEVTTPQIKYRRSLYPSYSWAGWKTQLYRDSDPPFKDVWIVWNHLDVGTGEIKRLDGQKAKPNTVEPPPYLYYYFKIQPTGTDEKALSEAIKLQIHYPVLIFSTFCLKFRVKKFDPPSNYPYSSHCHGHHLYGRANRSYPVISLSWDEPGRDIGEFEFALIGMFDIFNYREHSSTRREAYWALILEWKGPVAERIGLAAIPEKALKNPLEPGIVWKQIRLA